MTGRQRRTSSGPTHIRTSTHNCRTCLHNIDESYNRYGEEWHQGGTKKNKQNVFDDFIGCAEYLVSNGYLVMAYVVMEYVVMEYVVMAYVVMAYVVMA